MSINPAGIILLILGAVAVIVGVRGTQGKVFDSLTGKSGAVSPLGPGTSAAVGSEPYDPGSPTTTTPTPSGSTITVGPSSGIQGN